MEGEEKLNIQLLVFQIQGQTMYSIQILTPSSELKHFRACAGQQLGITNQANFAEVWLEKSLLVTWFPILLYKCKFPIGTLFIVGELPSHCSEELPQFQEL